MRDIKIFQKGDRVPFYKPINGVMNATFGCMCEVEELNNMFVVKALEYSDLLIYSDLVYRAVKPVHFTIGYSFEFESTNPLI